MKVYHLKSCDTCRKAIKALSGFSPELIDVRADGMPADVLAKVLEAVGPDVLINTRSTTWRGLSAAEKNLPAIELLSENPTLMKRPVILMNGKITVGWTSQVQTELGL